MTPATDKRNPAIADMSFGNLMISSVAIDLVKWTPILGPVA
jgi:hypothetical protein